MPLQQTSGAASYDAFGGGVAAVPKYIEDYFSTFLYQGTGASNTINNGIDLSTKGGLVWIKQRNQATSHRLFDTARGVQNSLASNSTAATASFSGYLTAFNTNGFTVGSANDVNESGFPLTSWSIAKAPKFFDVVTWTGDGTSGRTISHSLGSAPACVFVKRTNSAADWAVYHRSLSESASYSYNLFLNGTYAQANDSLFGLHSQQTSTQFKLGSNANAALINNTGDTYVAYLFAHNAGGFGLTGTDNVISCGSWSGNTTVNLGYEPQWILFRNSGAADYWTIVDNMRGWPEGAFSQQEQLYANSSSAASGGSGVYPTATGFSTNIGAGTYIYIAIRRGPMKVPTDGTKVFAPVAYTGDGSSTRDLTFGFPVDMFLVNYRGVSAQRYLRDRLRGGTVYLSTPSTSAEAASYTVGFDSNTGINDIPPAWDNASGFTFVDYGFQRAPSFFDEVCYTGNGSAGTAVTHNLGVTPELLIVKRRDSAGTDWRVWSASVNSGNARGFLNDTAAFFNNDNGAIWGNGSAYVAPTSTTFTVSANASVNASAGTYVAYLFATCAGVSKVGSYTGNGTTQTINCGFTGGARFVLIKRTDSTGNWGVLDTARGMVSGTDPYLNLNTTAAEVNANNVYTTTGGFQLVSSDANFNANGGSYIFLAVA